MKAELKKNFCYMLDKFVDFELATFIEEIFPKEEWHRVLPGFKDLKYALELMEKFKCPIKEELK